MLGQLPQSLEVQGAEYEIRTDYRNVLAIFEAFEDPDLTDQEKAYVLLKRIYVDFDRMPRRAYGDAYEKAARFIDGRNAGKKTGPQPKLVNWVKDEQMIFPAVNKVAGCEVRLLDYLHWWTFLGYFETIDHEDLWAFVLTIRQKKAKGKKLEKYEKEFYNANRDICTVEVSGAVKKPEDALQEMFKSLLPDGGEE